MVILFLIHIPSAYPYSSSVLVAACEKKKVRLYDTIACRQYQEITAAHADCVNCVKYVQFLHN